MLQGLYSGHIEIWTPQKRAKNKDKSGQFDNFPAQAARKLTKSGQNGDIFEKFLYQKDCPNFFTRKSKIGTK